MGTIEVTISPNGQTRVETKGFRGSTCREASRFLEQALGAKKTEQLTGEFYQQDISHSQHLEQEK